jgi:hypothetical protein
MKWYEMNYKDTKICLFFNKLGEIVFFLFGFLMFSFVCICAKFGVWFAMKIDKLSNKRKKNDIFKD